MADVASMGWDTESAWLRRDRDYGQKGNRTPAQVKAALEASLLTISKLEEGGLYGYTDGSSLGNPGASGAGICFEGAGLGLPDMEWALGHNTNNVAELFAIGAAAEAIYVARREGLGIGHRAFILSDSELNLRRLNKPAKDSDDLLLIDVRWALDRCREQGPISLVWVPGHVGVPGNERADDCAGTAAVRSGSLGCREPQGALPEFRFLTRDRVEAFRNKAVLMAPGCSPVTP